MTHEEVIHNPDDPDFTMAIIIPRDFKGNSDSCKFLTPQDAPLQLGIQRRPKGWSIKPHVHNIRNDYIIYTHETVFIQWGCMDVDLYIIHHKKSPQYYCTRTLHEGDVIHLMYCGHSFRLREETQFVEVKQGPYRGEDEDKVRFNV